ncbi:hypothetical protein BJY04DRAFT_188556 [Aspergillus karnatakaensis]|uniref:SDR family oxidoreductase n=1 Tax=Aspergillus karnatakaensis TaxID=1810916 RepID=UPI003CCDDF53
MATNTIYFITGANRGIGLGLVKSLLARSYTTVIATVRNEDAVRSLNTETSTVTVGENSIIHVLTLDFTAAVDPSTILNTLTTNVSDISHIDVLIANAGFAPSMSPALATTAEDLRRSFETNTIAPLLVFQALHPLLIKSPTGAPKTIFISSSVGSIGAQEQIPGGAYGASRAAGNWLTRAIHMQHAADNLVVVALHPGWVQTRAGEFVAKEWNYAPGPPVTAEDSVKGILEVVDKATRDTVGGKFITQTGHELPW